MSALRILRTRIFDQWLLNLRDRQGRAKIGGRLRRLQEGNPGDTRSVGGNVLEMRIDFGPGYRVYYVRRGDTLVVLLCGGDKDSQSRDIERAKELAALIREDVP